ncbi:deleted in malignant brain tumors 1 protein-like isoform X2 [Channa argus]|uniref:deleted in malignant brain tumors 1 protein-like isoform X2 n=1 Tax=Channa argus TaxID=215402 RepID=UPI003522E3C0
MMLLSAKKLHFVLYLSLGLLSLSLLTECEKVRLVNGPSRCSGRVEIFYRDGWGTVCDDRWDLANADVVCRELNCGVALEAKKSAFFGQGKDQIWLDDVRCSGNEASILKCEHRPLGENNCGHGEDAGVVCLDSQAIRLINGTNRCSGRVELFHNGQWGTICDDRWGMQEAAVACRQMNCGNALAVKYKAFFGRGQDQVWLDDVECIGSEKTFADCPHRGFGEHDCDHNEDAGVVCSESVRLVNGTDQCSGRVEVFHDGQWRKMCTNNWGPNEATVVCKELFCGAPKKQKESIYYGESNLRGFTGRCVGNVSSISQCTLEEHTGTCQGVSLSCAGFSPMRLVNGSDRCSGRVEILHDGQWGTVCDDEWDIRDAQVVCRVLDCGTALTAKSGGFFGQGHGDIWMDDVNCVGNETSLEHCQHPSFGENNCGHGEDAGVICSATLRLINGTDQCSGRLEVYHNEHWLPAYKVNWEMTEATVVCREMNCGDPVTVTSSFGQSGDLRGYSIKCSGTENSIAQCTLKEHVRSRNDNIEDATVVCSGNVKLADGSNRCSGRVEFYDQGRWGTVCGESWDMNDAKVVCKQLNCGKAHKITTLTEYGHGSGHIWIDQIECIGMESTLIQCPQRPFRDRTCNTTTVAGVVCTGSLEARLVNGKDECSGRVEVQHGEMWRTVCDTDWTLSKAQSVCELLECGQAVNALVNASFGQGSGSGVAATDLCFKNMTTLQQCSIKGFSPGTCGHEHDAGITCAAHIRLVGGSGECSGRVEVLYKSQWGTVCDDDWGMSNGDVVCRQLGCGHAVSAPTSAHFGRGTGPIWLDNVDCSGQETALSQCTHPGFGINNCGHSEDAGVICLGALQKPQISLSPGPEVNWGEKVEITCTIVTEHSGGTFVLKRTQDSFKMERFSEHEAATFGFTAQFDHKGSYFCEYQKKLANQIIYYPQGNVAELSVTVKLEKPRISLTSPHAMVIYSPDRISVNQGNGFSISCSTYSTYAGGVFYLKMSSTNTSEVQSAFGHMLYVANFDIPAVEYKHQGDYTCVYGVNVSSRSFCSVPSNSLKVTVVATSSSSAVTGVVVGLVVLVLVLAIGYFVWRRRLRGAGTMVKFTNRFGGAIKHADAEERTNGAFDGRDRKTQSNQYAERSTPGNKSADAVLDNSVERIPEDLAGRVCYELEPLVFS